MHRPCGASRCRKRSSLGIVKYIFSFRPFFSLCYWTSARWYYTLRQASHCDRHATAALQPEGVVQFALLLQLLDDVQTADQLALDVQLRVRRPVGERPQTLTNLPTRDNTATMIRKSVTTALRKQTGPAGQSGQETHTHTHTHTYWLLHQPNVTFATPLTDSSVKISKCPNSTGTSLSSSTCTSGRQQVSFQ